MSRTGRALAAASVLALTLTACTGEEEPPGPAEPRGPIAVAHTDAVISEAVAAVVERHLRNGGHDVAESDPVPQPWNRTDETTVAVVDTLAYALQVAPNEVMPEPPEPTPTAEPSDAADGSADPSGAGTTTDPSPSAGRSPSPSPSEEEASDGGETGAAEADDGFPDEPSTTASPTPTPLPNGDSAMGADRVDRLIEEHLARQAEQRRAAASPSGDPTSPADGASASAGAAVSASASDEVTVFAPSAGTLRLTALVTATTAARLDLEKIDDLNVLCEPLTAAARVDVNSESRPEGTRLLRERLDRLAGCRPGSWRPAFSAVTGDLVFDRAQLGLAYGIDPAVEGNDLVVLEDSGRVLPEGRMAVLGQAAHIPRATREDIREVMDRLDAEGLTELQELVSGPDALSPEDAAHYWLVDRGLEEAPEDWVVPQQGWF